MRAFAAVIQGVADLLVDDVCHLCRRRPDEMLARRLDPVRRAVAASATVRIPTGVRLATHPVCARCALDLEPTPGPSTLGWRLPGGAVLTRTGELVVAEGGATSPPGALPAVAAFRSNDTLLRVIHLVKFSHVTCLIDGLADAISLVAAPAVAELQRPLLVPVPMDRGATRRRGFNQSERIADALGERWGWKVATDALRKPRSTRAQSLMPRARRLPNVRGAFVAGRAEVEGRDVVLVDDLVTTGATAVVAAALLGSVGAASVTVVCVGQAA